MLGKLLSKIHTFIHLPYGVKLYLALAYFLLGISRLLILTIAFKRYAPLLGIQYGTAPWIPIVDQRAETSALHISQAIQIAAKYTPWESNCFPQAITARILLGFFKVPYNLFFGLNRNPMDENMQAHAWVVSGKVRVTGGNSFRKFTTVQCFSSINGLPQTHFNSR